jgi:putative two-component system response regulator
MGYEVFISYSHVDHEKANEICGKLKEIGVVAHLADKDIPIGKDINDGVSDLLDKCSHLIVIVSPASLKSNWVAFEIGSAYQKKIVILPFLIHPDLDVPDYIHSTKNATSISDIQEYFKNPAMDEHGHEEAKPLVSAPEMRQGALEDKMKQAGDLRLQVLLVDDEEALLSLFKDMLERNGFRVFATNSRSKAEQWWRATRCLKIALIDLSMPDDLEPSADLQLTGFRLIKALKESDSAFSCAFAAFSAHTKHQNLVRAIEAGCDAFISKGWEPSKIVETMRNLEQIVDSASAFIPLSKAIYMRSQYVTSHCERVMELCKKIIINHMNLNADNFDLCACLTAARIHDIGKIRLPDFILKGPNNFLSSEERRIIHKHVHVDDILSNIGLNFAKISDIILYHHLFFHKPMEATLADYPQKRPDGADSPRDKDIPIEARIIKVADVVDAMLSDRIYRSAGGIEEVLKDLERRKESGEFDPEAVNAFYRFIESDKGQRVITRILMTGILERTHDLQIYFNIKSITLGMMERILLFFSDIFLDEGRAVDRVMLIRGPEILNCMGDEKLSITVRGTKEDICALFDIIRNRMEESEKNRERAMESGLMELDTAAYLFHNLIPIYICAHEATRIGGLAERREFFIKKSGS